MSRLIIILLNPGFTFNNMKEIQSELNPVILRIIPENCTNLPCPYLTDGDELGERLILKQTKDWIIEEYKSDDDYIYRRLILTKNLDQIQSQFRITYIPKNSEKPTKELKSLLNEKKEYYIGIDQTYLDFDCHKLMVVGLALMEPNLLENSRVLVLGGGLCALSSFLLQHFKAFYIETVEISEDIIKIAEEMFEIKNEESFKVVCGDAWAFINKLAEGCGEEKKQIEEIKEEKETEEKIDLNLINDKRFDLIIIDINSEDVNEISPPDKFLTHDFLVNLQKCLSKNGMLFINFISKDEKILEKVIQEIAEIFHLVYAAKIENEYNTVIYAKNLKYQIDKVKDFKNEEEKIFVVLEDTVLDKSKIEINYKNMVKNLKKNWDQTLNLEVFLNNIILQFPNLNKNPFEKKNAQFLNFKENMTNNTKEMYIKDLEKISKNKKKKKSKNR